MLGWFVCIYRQAISKTLPATNMRQDEGLLAKWQTGLYGLDWLNKLVEEGKALEVATNNGYPIRYTATAKHFIPYIVDNPPTRGKIGLQTREMYFFHHGRGKQKLIKLK